MNYKSYIQLCGPLFETIQESALFPDPKTFVDSLPKKDPKTILSTFLKERNNPSFNLKNFVMKHFDFPHPPQKKIEAASMEEYMEKMWEVLTKNMKNTSPYSTLISLPKPHVVPGGRFRECFYWDSYFIALGLLASKKIESIKNMVINFSSLINRFGFIPNGNRIYFLSRSQAPYFSLLLRLLFENGEKDFALTHFLQLEKEYHFWMEGTSLLSSFCPTHKHTVYLKEGIILNRYWDCENVPRPEDYQKEKSLGEKCPNPEFFRSRRAACASGWDFSARWLKHPKKMHSIQILKLLPIDLNCLLFHLEETLFLFTSHLKEKKKARLYQNAALKRKKAILTYFWEEKEGFFFDYHLEEKGTTHFWSLAGVMPLFIKIATQKQANAVASNLEKKFLFKGGFVTTLQESGLQWDMPNGWAPLQWLTVQGLYNYKHHKLAQEGTKRWITLNKTIFNQLHKMVEKYNVKESSLHIVKGEYALQEGFGWTNGVALALLKNERKTAVA